MTLIKVGQSRSNEYWTIQTHSQHCAQDTERKSNKTKNTTQKTNKMSTTDPTKNTRVNPDVLEG
jgi:hypothetical protein